MNESYLEYKPSNTLSVRHYTRLQGVVERHGGIFIRPCSTVPEEVDYPRKPDQIKASLLKLYDHIEESKLFKAWVVFGKVTTEETHGELI
jgi:hypothetical protein